MKRVRSYGAEQDYAAGSVDSSQNALRLYSVCVFEDGLVVPWVRLVDAESDREAIGLARAISPSKRRELWDRHRLVAEFR